MRSFKDSEGMSWDIVVNLKTRALVSARTGLDLMLLGNGDKHTAELLLSPANSFGVLDALTEAQRLKRNLSVDDFGDRLNSEEVVDEALRAVIEAVFDFFPSPQAAVLRKTLLAVLEIEREESTKALTEAQAKIDSPDFKEKLREKLYPQEKPPKTNAGDSRESSGSTRPSSPGDSST